MVRLSPLRSTLILRLWIMRAKKSCQERTSSHQLRKPPELFHILNTAYRYSYTFIEDSIRNGSLADLQEHRAGPPEGTVRSVGSTIQPARRTRKKFTQDDDRILWNWVHETPQKGGGTDGNDIYKQLETLASWNPKCSRFDVC